MSNQTLHAALARLHGELQGSPPLGYEQRSVGPLSSARSAPASRRQCACASSARPRRGQAPSTGDSASLFGAAFGEILAARRQEADAFYDSITPARCTSEDEALIMRQALAGMLWSKPYYSFDLDGWLSEHRRTPPGRPEGIRNPGWAHMVNDDIISMPDKWEYPWYAAWDLALHTVALGMVDF